MNENANSNLLSKLVELSKIDIALARIVADKKKLEGELLILHGSLTKEETNRANKQKSLDAKNALYKKEEKRLKEEWEKLASRRKALGTLNNYKLQESGEKEIEHASRQIKTQEESLFVILEEAENLKKEIDIHAANHKKLKSDYSQMVKEARETLINLEQRNSSYFESRKLLADEVDSKDLLIYERVKEKHIMNPLVPVINNLCTGCNMQIGPQVLVLINKGEALAKCPGCARILHGDDSSAQSTQVSS